MRKFFNSENPLWQIFGFVGDAVVLSLLWTVCSAPILTAGAASAALYDAAVACFRRRETDYLRRFFRTLRRELKGSILPVLLWALILLGAWRGIQILTGMAAGTSGIVLTAVLLAAYMLPLGCVCWVFPLLSRFVLDFGTLNGNAVRLALGHIGSTYAMAIVTAVCVFLTIRLMLLPIFFLPALLALFFSVFLEPVFRQYEP